MNINLSILEKLNMSPKEAKTYIKLLELGQARANTVAKSISEKRTTTYSILDSMVEKGVASKTTKKGIIYYNAANPRALINQYIESANLLEFILPELLAIQNQYGQKPKITFYEGVEGIKQIGEILLEVPGSVRESFMGVDPEKIHPEIKKYYEEDFINRRIEAGIKYRGIITRYLPMGDRHPDNEKGQLRELKYVDAEKFPFDIHIDIFPSNKVAIYSYNRDSMMGVIIEHESFYKSMRAVFKLAWKGADYFS